MCLVFCRFFLESRLLGVMGCCRADFGLGLQGIADTLTLFVRPYQTAATAITPNNIGL